MRGKALYLCLLLFTAYVEVMYDDSHGILFWALSCCCFCHAGSGALSEVSCEGGGQGGSLLCEQGKARGGAGHGLKQGWLPASRIQGRFGLEDAWGFTDGQEVFQCEADARKRLTKVYRFPVAYCGKYSFCVKKAKVSDYLGLFRFSAGKESRMMSTCSGFL